MCEAGRIRHHLVNHITDPTTLILVVGFMAENTLGRKLVEHESPVNIFGDPYEVKAEVVIYNAFSGHADQKGDRKSTRLNSSHIPLSRMPSSA